MAKVKLNPIIEEIHGRQGNLVFRRSYKGEIYTIKRADMSNVQWSEAQQAHRQRFKEANAYAKAAMAQPKVRAVYEKSAAKQGRKAYFLAVSDYLKGNNLLEK